MASKLPRPTLFDDPPPDVAALPDPFCFLPELEGLLPEPEEPPPDGGGLPPRFISIRGGLKLPGFGLPLPALPLRFDPPLLPRCGEEPPLPGLPELPLDGGSIFRGTIFGVTAFGGVPFSLSPCFLPLLSPRELSLPEDDPGSGTVVPNWPGLPERGVIVTRPPPVASPVTFPPFDSCWP